MNGSVFTVIDRQSKMKNISYLNALCMMMIEMPYYKNVQ